MPKNAVTLVIFTCENREHLLRKTYESFLNACNFKFDKIILTIDGPVNDEIIPFINPDITIHHHARRGYVVSISKVLKLIDTPYFFWLEDDWFFHSRFDLNYQLGLLTKNADWSQVLFSKFGPLDEEHKRYPIKVNLYQTIFGFSTNPSLCVTGYVQDAFVSMESSTKGDKLGVNGFENYLSDYILKNNIKSIIIDPVDHVSISHDGYLESTPRNWHMTNSLEQKTEKHLLVIPKPQLWRRLYMVLKLTFAFVELAFRQLISDEAYELCFRVIASLIAIRKGEA